MVTARVHQDDLMLVQVCKALANPVRIQIMRYVWHHPGCIGTEILVNLPSGAPQAQSTLSQHLHVLREAELLDAVNDGPAICYFVNVDRMNDLQGLIADFGV